MNISDRLAKNALEHSRAIALARRAIRRARASKHRRFWYKWIERHEAQMMSCAKMIIRINAFHLGLKDGWDFWVENHSL